MSQAAVSYQRPSHDVPTPGPSPVKIVHICQPTDGGAAVVAFDLVRAAADAGFDVTLVAPAGGFLIDRARSLGVHCIELPMSRAPGVADLGLVRRLRPILRDADVVHLHSSKAGALGRLAALSLGPRRPRTIFTPHGWSWYVGGRLAAAYRLVERLLSPATDVITVVSGTELADGRATLGRRAPLELVVNGVDVAAYSPVGQSAERSSAPLIVQVGRLSVQKGQDRALRALARLSDQSTRLRLVGDGPLRDELVGLAAELGVTDRVEFLGSQDPRAQLRAADVVILPSRWEGMPLTLLEAMATGAAIVAADCGGCDALGSAGLTIGHADDNRAVDDLANRVEELMADPARRATLGQAARVRATGSYALDTTLQRHREIWTRPGRPTRRSGNGRVTSPERARGLVEVSAVAAGPEERASSLGDR